MHFKLCLENSVVVCIVHVHVGLNQLVSFFLFLNVSHQKPGEKRLRTFKQHEVIENKKKPKAKETSATVDSGEGKGLSVDLLRKVFNSVYTLFGDINILTDINVTIILTLIQ